VAGLTALQRDSILRRDAGLIRSYLSSATLRHVRYEYRPSFESADIEFHDYIRFSTLLTQGQALCQMLARVGLAPAVIQRPLRAWSRGRLDGPLDVPSYVRRRTTRTVPRQFPVRRVTTRHDVPENVLAASAAMMLLRELQAVAGRIALPQDATEGRLATQIHDAASSALRGPALQEVVAAGHLPEPGTATFAEVAHAVEERWRTRRISNRAYADIAQWCRDNRGTTLQVGGSLLGVAYGEDFDNRLFEIFVLARLRRTLIDLGFIQQIARPLHRRGEEAAFSFTHDDTAMTLDLYYQKAKGILWTESSPRHWHDLIGIPDIAIAARSASHPVIAVDAKNRRRGDWTDDGSTYERQATSEESHKMLGYFANFARRMVIGGRGPVGGLVFSTIGSGSVISTASDQGGLLVTVTIDPASPDIDTDNSPFYDFVTQLLRSAGLYGGLRPSGADIGRELAELHRTLNSVVSDEDIDARADRIHQWVIERIGQSQEVARAERDLEAHLLGDAWGLLTDDERRFLSTAEVFWSDHRYSVGMDFGPVVIELSKAVESAAHRLLFKPYLSWASQNARHTSRVDTLGDMRAELERASSLPPTGGARGARSLDEYLSQSRMTPYAYDELLLSLTRLNVVRRDAAHPRRVTSATAGTTRAWLLGVGGEQPMLHRLLVTLQP
jgi:hypothetical protein